MNKQERESRIIARGESQQHAHVIIGDAVVRNDNGEILIEVGNEGAVLRHIIETAWMEGQEIHTGEHDDIDLAELPLQIRQGDVLLERIATRTYKYIPQVEFDPYMNIVRPVME